MTQLNDFEMLAQRHERRTSVLARKADMITKGQQTSFLRLTPAATPVSSGFLASLHEFMFPSARAAIALTVYNACKKDGNGNVNAAACTAASVKALADSNAARNAFNGCWAKYENTKPKWVRALARAGCTAALVARLA
jgi:hypothetical protein